MNFEKKVAFTLAEMMVILLILSIVMAAFLPVITKRSKTPSGIWSYAANNSDVFFGTGNSQGAAIGTNGFLSSETGRLLLDTNGDTQNPIIFKQAGTRTANIVADSTNNTGLGNDDFSDTGSLPTRVKNATAIGTGAQVRLNNATAVGVGSIATGGVAIGNAATSSGGVAIGSAIPSSGGIAIGTGSTNSTNTNAVAIGNAASAGADSTVAIGESKALNQGGVAIGQGKAGTGGISIGMGNFGTGLQGISIGKYAYATGTNSISIGYNAHAEADNSITIGLSSWILPAYTNSIAIGGAANAKNAVALGWGADAEADNQFILGDIHNVYIPGSLTVVSTAYPSDRRLKNIQRNYTSSLDKVRKLKPMNFTYKNDTKKTPRVGVIAQDLQKVFPNAVTKGSDGFLLVRQEDMFYAMLNSIKELDNIVQGLRKDLQSLAARVQQLDDKVAAIIKVTQSHEKQIKALKSSNKALAAQNEQLKAKNNQFLVRLQKLEIKMKSKHKLY